MNIPSLQSQLEKFSLEHNFANFKTKVELRKSTWIGTGGIIDGLFKCRVPQELEDFLHALPPTIPIRALGATSNTIVKDAGFRGIIIRPHFTTMSKHQNPGSIEIGAGALCSVASQFAASYDISGFEFLYTIPGTIGGAIAMNAGCFGSEVKDIFVSAKALTYSGQKIILNHEDMHFQYRHTAQKDLIFCSAIFKGQEGQGSENILARMERLSEKRRLNQPQNCKTLGSTFCNIGKSQAWKLVDKVGLRGYKIGGARFSEKHCNFIINDGTASSMDVLDLIEYAKKKIQTELGIEVQQEIKVLE